MGEWIPVVIAIVVNLGAIIYAYGKLTSTVENLKIQMGVAADAKVRNDSKTERWQTKMETMPHSMLPECMQEFNEINKQLGVLSGKVDALLEMRNYGRPEDLRAH